MMAAGVGGCSCSEPLLMWTLPGHGNSLQGGWSVGAGEGIFCSGRWCMSRDRPGSPPEDQVAMAWRPGPTPIPPQPGL